MADKCNLCSCEKRAETWKQVSGRWICEAKKCIHHSNSGGCNIGKVSITCDNNSCEWNKKIDNYGIYVCLCMDIHLDAEGKCYGYKKKL